MATPNRAPRRTAAKMDLNVASGVPSPGANSYQVARKTANALDSGAYMKQRNAGKSGLNSGNVQMNK